MITLKEYDGTTLLKDSRYYYDALGRRVAKLHENHVDNGKSFARKYIYDGQEVLFELNGDNDLLTTFTHSTLRTDDVLAMDKGNASYFYLKDRLGTVNEIIDASGNIVQSYSYSAFGTILSIRDGADQVLTEPIIKNFYTFTGRESDFETGLNYYRARYYDSGMGRFLSSDPHPGTMSNPVTIINKYAYAGNNPIVNIDPNGEFFFNTTAIAGALAIWGKGSTRDFAIDWLFAEAAFVSIAATGGGLGAFQAVGSTAGGSVLAASAMSYGQTGSWTQNLAGNFHAMFRVGSTFLAGSALYGAATAPVGVSGQAGGNGITGYAGASSMGSEYTADSWQGLNLTGNAASITGPGNLGIFHESMHTAQFIGHSYLAGRMERNGQLGMSRWSFLYSSYIFANTPGAVTGAY